MYIYVFIFRLNYKLIKYENSYDLNLEGLKLVLSCYELKGLKKYFCKILCIYLFCYYNI